MLNRHPLAQLFRTIFLWKFFCGDISGKYDIKYFWSKLTLIGKNGIQLTRSRSRFLAFIIYFYIVYIKLLNQHGSSSLANISKGNNNYDRKI